jgi:SEC-C motif-containing protein
MQMARNPKPVAAACPCGSGKTLADCCGPCVEGAAVPPDAAALMRSRYTAYVLGREAYLLDSWHWSTRPVTLGLSVEPQPKWLGLEVLGHELIDADHATVAFVARYKLGGRAHRLHETSRFVREGTRWYYVDGDVA